ncbi:ABC-2 type transporter [Sulfitobacter noctilucicola]|uniref:ABC transporter permease n=1 Tax=Sulfitobacter noctilucicola TaxID=1342301 RepID=UPI00056D047B|nr:ABC transporter permease [Sulfitobacter noctilucicola]KIN62715.1 ABC-2 type transporter [Sulfitobacter noctilucicola]
MALILREMSTTYGRSPGGYIWAVLEPALGIALLTAIFSLGFKSPPIGINFPIFYATGMVPFLMFSSLSGSIATSLLFSKRLLAYPSVTFVDAIIGRLIVNGLTQLMVAYFILFGILMMFETRTVPDLLVIFQTFFLTIVLSLGVGTMNCFLFTMVPVWQRAWSVITRPLFILSCVLFLFETVPQPYRDILWYNPLVHVVGRMRSAFYPSYDAAYVSYTYVYSVALISLAVGLVFLSRYHRDMLNDG